eukprot:TRINITY_DN5383_c0_g1_i1.p1 TRINITY_DN5383_c0_g1~~TRINITY_DN5383_c0_g1_i1.p1  ORF type:complete len:247 (+),score=76.86 TRINITY_DN5383_c0_g1_i1:34-774(+)
MMADKMEEEKEGTRRPPFVVPEGWQKNMSAADVPKSVLDDIVMNFLVVEGFHEAAVAFSKEAGVQMPEDTCHLKERDSIRAGMQEGRVSESISLVNDLDTAVFDEEPDLLFAARQQELLELIRAGRLDEALSFAQLHLAPRALECPELLKEVEKAMSLLAFDTASAESSPVGHLLSSDHRLETASKINHAILRSQAQESRSTLSELLQMLQWSQEQLKEEGVPFPEMSASGEWVAVSADSEKAKKD